MLVERKYKIGDDVLIKGTIDGVSYSNYAEYPYEISFDTGTPAEWKEGFTETSIVGTADSLANESFREQGMQEAWELLRCVNSMSSADIKEAFDMRSLYDVLIRLPVEVAYELYIKWKESKNFTRGDVVEVCATDSYEKFLAVFYSEVNDEYWILEKDDPAPRTMLKRLWNLRKIPGRHVDIFAELDKEEWEI